MLNFAIYSLDLRWQEDNLAILIKCSVFFETFTPDLNVSTNYDVGAAHIPSFEHLRLRVMRRDLCKKYANRGTTVSTLPALRRMQVGAIVLPYK